MTQSDSLTQIIERIQQMETYLDKILEVLSSSMQPLHDLVGLENEISILRDYYDNGQWVQDYEADERGELPDTLKRGVLAEDTLYNLFIDIQEFRL